MKQGGRLDGSGMKQQEVLSWVPGSLSRLGTRYLAEGLVDGEKLLCNCGEGTEVPSASSSCQVVEEHAALRKQALRGRGWCPGHCLWFPG